jgi:hypothetical protein
LGPIRRSKWVALGQVLSILLRCCGSGPAALAERRKGGGCPFSWGASGRRSEVGLTGPELLAVADLITFGEDCSQGEGCVWWTTVWGDLLQVEQMEVSCL